MSTHARRARILAATGVVLLVAAGTVLVLGWRGQHHPPSPPAAAAKSVAAAPDPPREAPSIAGSGTTSPAQRPARSPGVAQLPRSTPVRIDIPSIGVSSRIQQLGLNVDGSIQVPPLGRDSHVGWYKYSPTPGQVGPSILLGHVDSARYGAGVFYRLGDLRQRERITVTRADHTVAQFQIERVVEYPKARFPTLQVYGNLDHPGLRLITCGGRFDPSKASYEDNIVVYASLVSSRRI